MRMSSPIALGLVLLLTPSVRAQGAEPGIGVGEPASRSAKVLRYCEYLLTELGATDPRGLERARWAELEGAEASWDQDHDGFLSGRELAARIRAYARHRSLRALAASAIEPAAIAPSVLEPSAAPTEPSPTDSAPAMPPRASAVAEARPEDTTVRAAPDTRFYVSPARRADGAPPWFTQRDLDGDGQVSLAEFAPQVTGRAAQEFRRYDANNDGVITRRESQRNPDAEGREAGDAVQAPARDERRSQRDSKARSPGASELPRHPRASSQRRERREPRERDAEGRRPDDSPSSRMSSAS